MANSGEDAGAPDTAGSNGRRDFVRNAAVVGTGAFVVPTIITVDPADAQALTSPPPRSPGRPESPPVDLGRSPGTVPPPTPGTQPDLAAGSRTAARTELPGSGANLDRLTAARLAATAGGAALALWGARSQDRRRQVR